MTTDSHSDLLLRYAHALHDDPNAAPPPGLDADDIAIARDLARLYARPPVSADQRSRIWQRALAEAQREPHTPIHTNNGRTARQETTSMYKAPALSHPLPQPRKSTAPNRTRGLWVMGLVAALAVMISGGLLLAQPGDPSPTDPISGAGLLQATPTALVQEATLTPMGHPSPTAIPPIPTFKATARIFVFQGPDHIYPVIGTLTENTTFNVFGRTTDSAWYLVNLSPGEQGWIMSDSPFEILSGTLISIPNLDVPIPTVTDTSFLGNDVYETNAVVTMTPVMNSEYTTELDTAMPPGVVTMTPSPTMSWTASPTWTLTPTASPTALNFESSTTYSGRLRLTDELIAFSPDGRFLAVGAAASHIMIYSTSNLQATIAVMDNHTNEVTALAFHPQSTILASGSKNGIVHLSDPETGELLKIFTVCEDCEITDIYFNPNGTVLVIQTTDETQLWGLLP